MKNIYEIIFFVVFLILYTVINLNLIRKERRNNHLIYKFMSFILVLFLLQGNLYLNFFKLFLFSGICFVFWVGFTLWMQNKNMQLTENEDVEKLKLNFVAVAAVLSQILFHIFNGFKESLIKYQKKRVFSFIGDYICISASS